MHRAKHRAAGSSAVLATTLIERFADVPTPRTSGPRHGTATLPAPGTALDVAPETAIDAEFDADFEAAFDAAFDPEFDAAFDAAPGGPALFGAAPCSAPMLAPAADDRPSGGAAPLFAGADDLVPQPRHAEPFGAARHARARTLPVPHLPSLPTGSFTLPALPTLPNLRSQPVGAALGVTVLGAAAAMTAVVVPPPAGVETTGSMAPIQIPAPAPLPALGEVLAPAPAPAALPDRPTLRVPEMVTEVTGQMNKVEAPVATSIVNVAQAATLTSPAAVRKAAVTNALGKLGVPYRWGAVGPNAFDCSGLVKWSFANAGKSLPRTSRAMASVGVPVKRADLQPGDLVFFYTPISHVGIYLGNGKIVHASRTGKPVMISDMSRMRFTTARRV